MIMPPCKDCPDRHQACHDRCEKYKAFAAELEKAKKYNNEKNLFTMSDHGRRDIWRRMRGQTRKIRKPEKDGG